MLKVENLNKFYNKGKQNQLHVTKNISLEFQATGLVCILGESGCGKTTFINEIGGLDNYNSGQIVIDNKKINGYQQNKIDKIRTEKFGYIFQNFYLLQNRTVEYNIELILNMYKLSKEEKEKRINYVLKTVDMDKYKKRIVSQLSGGQQQRVAIARALVKSPAIVFADEPTGNLDELNTLKIINILKKISESCLVILVTHDENLAECFADRVIRMSDGQIIADNINQNKSIVYNFVDSSKIYLNDIEKKAYDTDDVNINLYDEDKKESEIKLNIVYENDKVYVSSANENIVYISKNSGVKMVHESVPRLTIEDLNKIQYSIDKIDSQKTPKLHFMDLLRFTAANFKSMGKKRIILGLSFFMVSILLAIFIANWITINNVDYKSCVYTDSHILNIKVTKAKAIGANEFNDIQYKIYQEIKELDNTAKIYPVPTNKMNYIYNGFFQMQGQSFSLNKFSPVDINRLSEDKLIYGRMPENMHEIVVDIWVVDNLRKDTSLNDLIINYQDIIGSTMDAKTKNDINGFEIVGVCDTNAPNIYLNTSGLYMLSEKYSNICAASELNKVTNQKYLSPSLKNKEILISDTLYNKISNEDRKNKQFVLHDSAKYNIAGRIETNDIDEQMSRLIYVSDESMGLAGIDMAVGNSTGCIYANEAEKMLNYIKATIIPKYKGTVNIVVAYPYQKQTRAVENAKALKIDTSSIITLGIMIVAVLISYFIIKSNVIKNIKDISVYRLLGITRLNIASSFALEIAIITTYSSVIGCILMGIILNFISGIDSLSISFIYPWHMVAVTILIIYVVNTVISVIPVMSILKLPPAQLAAKYDM